MRVTKINFNKEYQQKIRNENLGINKAAGFIEE